MSKTRRLTILNDDAGSRVILSGDAISRLNGKEPITRPAHNPNAHHSPQSVVPDVVFDELQEQVRELKAQNDLLWKAANGKLMGDLQKIEEKHFQQKHPNPCPEVRDQLAECYKNHKNTPLHCSSLVKQFAECTRQARKQLI